MTRSDVDPLKAVVLGFPRHFGPTPGHLSECLVVAKAEQVAEYGGEWPPKFGTYCTCDDYSPE